MDRTAIRNRSITLLSLLAIAVIGSIVGMEIYSIVVQPEGSLPLPSLFGNFERIRDGLQSEPPKDLFRFAVVGDIKSFGKFEAISEDMRKREIDFGVLLGDCTRHGTQPEHRYLRAECQDEGAQDFPVFYVVGNHDVSPADFTVSDFEATYGPTMFSFEYQGCLFLFLRTLGRGHDGTATIAFLEEILRKHPEQYRKRFAFMHMPVPLPGPYEAHTFAHGEDVIKLFDRIGIDYAFAGDFHGYAEIRHGNTTYIITGGGGARLNQSQGEQFHHAVVVEVGKEHIAEQILNVRTGQSFEDTLEYHAFVSVYPLMSRHRLATILLNVLLLAAAIPPIRAVVRACRTRASMPAPHR